MDTYRNTAAYLKNNPLVIVKVIEITFIQRMALFAVTWFVYQAFGLHGTGFWDILFLQAVISVSVDMLPLPGGMGISETLFLPFSVRYSVACCFREWCLAEGWDITESC